VIRHKQTTDGTGNGFTVGGVTELVISAADKDRLGALWEKLNTPLVPAVQNKGCPSF
jgi:hypothetical protein